jgi:hypothetical protein
MNENFMEQIKDLIFDLIIANDKDIQAIAEIIQEYDCRKYFCTYEDLEVYAKKIDIVFQKIYSNLEIESISYSIDLPTEEEIRAYFEN